MSNQMSIGQWQFQTWNCSAIWAQARDLTLTDNKEYSRHVTYSMVHISKYLFGGNMI